MPKVKIYGESHGDDGLLDACVEIFREAHRDNYKKCFIEQTPDSQAYINDLVEQANPYLAFRRSAGLVSSPHYNLDSDPLIKMQKDSYNACSRFDDIRHNMKNDFLALLSLHTGIKLICHDVAHAATPDIDDKIRFFAVIQRVGEFTGSAPGHYEKVENMSDREFAETFDCSVDDAKKFFGLLKSEEEAHAFVEGLKRDFATRIAYDADVADFIMSEAGGEDFFVICGQAHADLNEPHSLASVLADRLGDALEVFDITEGRITKMQKPARTAGSAVLPGQKPGPTG